MLYFHVNNNSHKSFNISPQPRYFTLPKQSGTLATEEDVKSNVLVSMIGKPTITFPSEGSVSFNNSITFTKFNRNPLYIGPKTHVEVEVSLNPEFTTTVYKKKEEDTDESKVTLNLPIDVSITKVYIRIRYFSNLYSSPWSDPLSVTTKQFKIGTPTILTPADSSTGVVENIVISGSSFNYIGISDTHISTTYQVSLNSNFSTFVVNTTSMTELTSKLVNLDHGKTYYIRIRYTGNKYGNSDWSATVKFTIPSFKINTPTITSPTNGMSVIAETITVSTSAFSFVGVGETHASTTYQIATDTGFSNLVINTTSTTSLRSFIASIGNNTTYYVRVRHNGTKYGSSNWSPVIKFSIPKFKVNTPSITAPANGGSAIVESVTVSTSAFSFVGVGETHASTTYQIATDTGFSNLVINTTSTSGLRSLAHTLTYNKKYYFRVRHTGRKYGNSDWSATISFTIPNFYINTPSITTPTNNVSGINKNIVISTSAFSYVGVANTHASTTYQISSDINFNNIVFNSTSTTALRSLTATMEEGKTYFIRVRHNGTKYGSSNWSNVIKVSTVVPVRLVNSNVVVTLTHSNNLGKTARFRIYNDGSTLARRRDDGPWENGPKLFENVTGQQLYFKRNLVNSYMVGNSFSAPNITTPTAIGDQEISIYKVTANKTRVYIIVDYEIFDSSKNFLFTIRVDFGYVKS